MHDSTHRLRLTSWYRIAALVALAGMPATLRADRTLALAGAGSAWQTQVGLRAVDTLRGLHLLDEYLFIMATDGKVRAIRADNGDHLWTRTMTREGDTLWPPRLLRIEPLDAVLFTRLADVVVLDLEYGEQVGVVPLRTASTGPAVGTPESLFVNEVDRRVSCYDLEGRFLRWQVKAGAGLESPPVLVPEQGVIYFADRGGRVVAATMEGKEEIFTVRIEAAPSGSIAADAGALYLADAGRLLYALDRRTGSRLWSVRLPAPPVDGPTVTPKSVYQATLGGGVQRVSLDAETGGNWFAPDARQFLAEWPTRTVLLQTDGRLAFVRPDTGDVVDLVDVGGLRYGVSNPGSDLVIVATSGGHIQCFRPIGAPPLTAGDLRAPPLSGPAEDDEEDEDADGDTGG